MTAVPESPVPATELPPAAGTGPTLEVQGPDGAWRRIAGITKVTVGDDRARHPGRPHADDVCCYRCARCLGRFELAPLRFELDVPMLPGPKDHGPVAQRREPLNANWRLHHMVRRERVAIIRNGVSTAARHAGIPKCRHLTVTLHYRPGDNRRRDADNLVPTLKAACDALARGPRRDWVGLELVPDDTPEHMTKRMPVIHPGPGERRLWLEIEVTR